MTTVSPSVSGISDGKKEMMTREQRGIPSRTFRALLSIDYSLKNA